MSKVECPYCGTENDVRDCLQGLDSDNNTDWECNECEEEFEITVEFEPSYSADKIVYEECQSCGDSVRDIRKFKCIFPFPKIHEGKNICRRCWKKAMSDEYEARKKG